MYQNIVIKNLFMIYLLKKTEMERSGNPTYAGIGDFTSGHEHVSCFTNRCHDIIWGPGTNILIYYSYLCNTQPPFSGESHDAGFKLTRTSKHGVKIRRKMVLHFNTKPTSILSTKRILL